MMKVGIASRSRGSESRSAPADSGTIRLPDKRSGRMKLGLLGQRRLRCAGGANVAVATGKLLNTACRIDELLFTGEVRMAGRADTDLDILASRAGLVGSTAGANDRGGVIFGMKTSFHRAGYFASRNPLRQ